MIPAAAGWPKHRAASRPTSLPGLIVRGLTVRGLALLTVVLGVGLAGCSPVERGTGPLLHDSGPPEVASAESTPAGDSITMADGAALPLRHWLPEEPAQAVLLALHGFADYSIAFEGVGPHLAARGIAVYAYDQRGFGAAPNPGYWPGIATLRRDLATAVELLRGRHPDLPLAVLGESMGGAVVAAALADGGDAGEADGFRMPAVDAAILVAPAVRGRQLLSALERGVFWVFSHTVPWWPVTPGTLPIHVVPSDNIEMLRARGRDPLVPREFRLDLVWGLVDAMSEGLDAAPSLPRLPVLLQYGLRDDLVPAEAVATFLDRVPESRPLTVALYPRNYHMLLRDLTAVSILDDLAIWILDPAASLPSGADRIPASVLRDADALAAARAGTFPLP